MLCLRHGVLFPLHSLGCFIMDIQNGGGGGWSINDASRFLCMFFMACLRTIRLYSISVASAASAHNIPFYLHATYTYTFAQLGVFCTDLVYGPTIEGDLSFALFCWNIA